MTYAFAQSNLSGLEPEIEAGGLDESQVSYSQVVAGVVFNLLYHLVIILIFSAVVSGIIIDSFAELRAKNKAIRDDIVGTCFICNIEREDFEQLNLPFKTHIKEEHNL